MSWRIPVECSDTEHWVEIDDQGNMDLLDHNLQMLQGFSAFGATKPECLRFWERWKKYRKAVVNVPLGVEAFMANVRAHEFVRLQQKWDEMMQERQTKDAGKRIPDVTAKSGGLMMMKLPPRDPRGLFLGKHTGSGRHPGGYAGGGEEAAWHGVTSPTGSFYIVVDQDDEIVGESWVWRHGDVVMFDGISGKGLVDDQTRKFFFDLMEAAAMAMLRQDLTIAEVRTGPAYARDIMSLIQGREWAVPWPEAEIYVPPPFGALIHYHVGPTPSSRHQHVIAKQTLDGTLYFTEPLEDYGRDLAEAIKEMLSQRRPSSTVLAQLGYFARKAAPEFAPVVEVVHREEEETEASRRIREVHELQVGGHPIAEWAPCFLGRFTDVYGNDWETEECEESVAPDENLMIILEEAIPGYTHELEPEETYGLPYPNDAGMFSTWLDDKIHIGSFDEQGDAVDAGNFVADVLRLAEEPGDVGVYQLVDWIDPETEYWYPGDIANWERIL
jgi:hypothetical protein